MQDRPTQRELLETVANFLRDALLPLTGERTRYHLLVALNLLSILARETELEPAHLQAEDARLNDLLEEAPPPESAAADTPAGAVRAANERLCAEIRAGAFDAGEPLFRLLEHLRATLAEKLSVANPAFLEGVRREEAGTAPPD